jgi:hypothetical protein
MSLKKQKREEHSTYASGGHAGDNKNVKIFGTQPAEISMFEFRKESQTETNDRML